MAENAFRWDYKVCYADCTVGNHVYYARYLDILERARGEFFRKSGKPLLSLQEEDTTFPVIECHLKYHAPARYDDLVIIEVELAEAKGIRAKFRQRLLSADGRLLVECETTHVCASVTGKPKRLLEELVAMWNGAAAG